MIRATVRTMMMLGALAFAAPALAQGAKQTVGVIDLSSVSTGYRSSKIVGSTVYNAQNDNVGKIDDLIVSADGKTPYAVLSVGGFLGVGSHLVAVPFTSLHLAQDRITLPNASKAELVKMPEFKYAS